MSGLDYSLTKSSMNCQGIIMTMLNMTTSHGTYIYAGSLSNMWKKETCTSCQHSKHILIFSSRGVKNRDIMPMVKTPLMASLSESAGGGAHRMVVGVRYDAACRNGRGRRRARRGRDASTPRACSYRETLTKIWTRMTCASSPSPRRSAWRRSARDERKDVSDRWWA